MPILLERTATVLSAADSVEVSTVRSSLSRASARAAVATDRGGPVSTWSPQQQACQSTFERRSSFDTKAITPDEALKQLAMQEEACKEQAARPPEERGEVSGGEGQSGASCLCLPTLSLARCLPALVSPCACCYSKLQNVCAGGLSVPGHVPQGQR